MSVLADVAAAPPTDVLAAWGWHRDVEVAPLAGGLINTTFVVRRAGQPEAVVQRLHPVFAPEVNLDLEAVTAHLAHRGLTTPRLVRTLDGHAWIVDDHGRPWRALTWIDGVSVHAVPGPALARAGGELVGRFHRAVADLDHDYAFARAGVHDTAGHLARLRERLASAADTPAADFELRAEAVELGHAIVAAARSLPELPDLPRRHTHGDLKISNLLFAALEPPRAAALVDLDTLGRQTLAFELGDAMRSWCNPHGEDAGAVRFDLAIFAAAIEGWAEVAGGLFTDDERRSIATGLETVCVELAARFASDIFDDRYFGWDPARFPSRRAHNLVRARGQLALAAAVGDVRDDALAIVRA
ncbi:MAG TPA: phosphotransferase [Kofleriaceae bacterium]|nr:phosphotransferase [Kofleriaceae bacterium]